MMIHQPPSIMSDVRLSAKSAAIPIVRSRSCNPYRMGGRLSPQPCPENENKDGSIDRDEDVLSPLPGDNEEHSAASSPGAVLSRSPGMRLGCNSPGIRRRSNTLDSVNFVKKTHSAHGLPLPVTVPKDPIQPRQGSIQDIHSTGREEDDEEDDVFSELMYMRPRSNTCPASMAKLRKAKLRSMRRPPTPPPMDLIDSHIRTPLANSHSSSVEEIEDDECKEQDARSHCHNNCDLSPR